MHGHKLHDLKHNEYTNSQTLNDIHVAIDTRRLIQHMLQVMEMAWTDDSTLAILHVLPVASIALESSDFDIGTVSQATKTNSIEKLLCGYIYRSSQ